MNENFQNDVNENKASENIVNENETSVENNVVLTSFKKRYFDFIEKAKIDFKQYQFDGVLFMLESEKKNKGGFLFDEMGLGKTISIIMLLYLNFHKKTLIVLPPVLIQQWFDTIFEKTGHKSTIFHGKQKKNITQNDLEQSNIVLTSYSHLSSPLIQQTKWNRVIFDEAHNLRNPKTERFKHSKSLTFEMSWFLTGTPFQNKKLDILSLINIGKFDIYKSSSFILKRTKEQVNIDLPKLNVIVENIKWENEKEKTLAKDIHSGSLLTTQGKGRQLEKITRSRQVCILPTLLDLHLEKCKKIHNNNISNPETCDDIIIKKDYDYGVKCSTKITHIIDSVSKNINNGNKKLIFCYFSKEIDFISDELTKIHKDKKIAIYDGRHKKDVLTQECDILIIQILSGSDGLNLQQFNEIYFTSIHWNPFVELQAIARCHRIGQKKQVFVYKFIMNDFNKNNENRNDKDKDKEEIDMDVKSIENQIIETQEKKITDNNELLTELRIT
jgi:SNF2 family DNA or RNA helicase